MADQILPPLAFLGAGSMGGAIIRGVVASGAAPLLTATNRSQQKADELGGIPGVTSIALEVDPDGNRAAAADADVVVLGVKPVGIPALLREIAPHLRPGTIIVSVAAGVTTRTCADIVGPDIAVIRAMPNTPAIVREGITGIAAGPGASEHDMATVRALFETCGAVIEVPEEQIDALSTISGSGPAYVFLLIEALTEAARGKGFTEEQARLMAEKTFVGATSLLTATGEDPAELRRKVTSPKGTTERAVAVLESGNLPGLFAEATDAALARAEELAVGA